MGSKKRGGKMQSNEFYEKLEDGFLNPDDFTSDYSKSVSPTVEETEQGWLAGTPGTRRTG